MKKLIYLLSFLAVGALAFAVFINPFIIFLVKKQIVQALPGSVVSVKGCEFHPFEQLRIFDLEIKSGKTYDFRLKEAAVRYHLAALLQKNILRVSLKDGDFALHLPQDIATLARQAGRGSSTGMFAVQTFEVLNLNLNLKAQDLNVSGRVSGTLSLAEQEIKDIDVKVNVLEAGDFHLTNGFLQAGPKPGPGNFRVEKLQYGKFTVDDLQSQAYLRGKELVLDHLSGQVLAGQLAGELKVTLSLLPSYVAQVQFSNLDLARGVEDFDLKEKIRMSGLADGRLILNGRGEKIQILDGEASIQKSGGNLIINDNEFLKRIAKTSRQPLDIVVESLKNYHYNVGDIKLFLDQGNLTCEMALEGEAGKRNINITIHDFNLEKGGL